MFSAHFLPKVQKATKVDRTDFESFRFDFKSYQHLRNSNCKKPRLDPTNVEKLTCDLLDSVFREKKENVSFKKENFLDFPYG